MPTGWTAPKTASSSAGYATASSGTVSVSGQLITVSNLIMSANSQLTVTYGAGGGASSVLPSSTTGPATFVTEEQSSQFGMLTPIASSPVVQVAMLSAQTLTLDQGTGLDLRRIGHGHQRRRDGDLGWIQLARGEAIIGNTLYVLDADAIRAVSTSNGAVSTIVGPASSGGGNYTDSSEPGRRHLRQPVEPHHRRGVPLLRRQRQHQAHRSCDGGDDDGYGAGYTGCGGSFTGLTEGADGNLYATALNNATTTAITTTTASFQLNR